MQYFLARINLLEAQDLLEFYSWTNLSTSSDLPHLLPAAGAPWPMSIALMRRYIHSLRFIFFSCLATKTKHDKFFSSYPFKNGENYKIYHILQTKLFIIFQADKWNAWVNTISIFRTHYITTTSKRERMPGPRLSYKRSVQHWHSGWRNT